MLLDKVSLSHRVPKLPWHAKILLLVVFGFSASVGHAVDVERGSAPQLVVEIRSDTTSTAQLFYDTGAGMREAESAIAAVAASTTFATVHFALPERPVYALRLDPITGAGTFAVRRVYLIDRFGRVVHQFTPNDLVPLNQIASRLETPSEAVFATIPGADDPTLRLTFTGVLSASPRIRHRLAHVLFVLVVALLVTSLAAAACYVIERHRSSYGRPVDLMAAALSDPAFLVLDRLAIGWYIGTVAVFLVAVSAGIHGSGLSLLSSMGPADGAVQPSVGWPKATRSDEWGYHTPAILHQIYRDKPFATERTALGPEGTALISNVPILHITTLFRPQFWGFFVLPPPYGFSFYWQFKAVLLLSGVFTLLLLLTRSSKLAAVGALWYASSPWTQWTYSWPSLLPDLIGLFCLVLCATFYLSVGRRPGLLLAAAYICVSCAVNFALCAYVPHLIPAAWFGVLLCGWWMSVKWKAIARRDGLTPRLLAFCGTWLAVAILVFVIYDEAESALTTLANTSYPGRRSLSGGQYSVLMLFSHFFSFWADEAHFPLPQSFTNVSEWAGFFWLAPVTLFCLRTMGQDTCRRRAYYTLLISGALLLAWLTLPVPQVIGQALFLDKSGSHRSQHVLGLINVGLVMLSMSLSRRSDEGRQKSRRTLALGAVAFALVFPAFWAINVALESFLTVTQTAAAAAYFAILIVTIVQNRLTLFAACLLVPQLAIFGLVNPVGRGLRLVESSPLFQLVHSRPELLRDRWIVYSRSFPHSGFFSAVGCEVVTGLDYVPDLKSLSEFDPTGAQREIINRSVYFLADPKYDGGPARFELLTFQLVRWHVSPLDPGLRRIGVRYAAFAERPPAHVAALLKPLSSEPISGFWLYELPDPI